MPPNSTITLARVATGFVSVIAALIVLAFCIVIPLQAQQAARLGADSGQATPCAVSTLCTCQSNEKQLGQALIEYTQDFDEKLPQGTQQRSQNLTRGFSGVGWAGQIYPYVKTTNTFKCPSDLTTASAPAYPVSYGFSSNIPDLPQALFQDPSITVSLFEISGDPAQITSINEGASQGADLFSAAGDGTDHALYAAKDARLNTSVLYATGQIGLRPKSNLPHSQEPSFYGRHRQGANYLLLDGHAHWYLPSDVSSGKTATNVNAPQTGRVHGNAAGYDAPPYQITFSLE